MTLLWLLIAVGCIGISGVPGLLAGRRSPLGQWLATALNVAGSGIGCAALAVRYAHPGSAPGSADGVGFNWGLPLGRFAVGVDDLSGLFLFPIFFVPALGSVYGLGYWRQAEHPGNGRKLRLCWGLLTAGMALVVLARDSVVLLMAWEVMALAAYFLVCTEENKPQARDAAWVYLVATHVGTLCLFAFFALLRHASGSFELWHSLPPAVSKGTAAGLFVLGVVGFGLKAGIMPLHVWLPGAHANAPSHVSAIMSGVLLKTGVYGLLRVGGLLPHPPEWWGATLLTAGTVSAVTGIAFAVGQRDLKRLLAYSSIENVGIITMGIGLALLGRASGHPDWARLGLAGALLHVLNHSLFKPLLFLGSGGIVHAARTREMDLLGGMGKTMPRTFAIFFIGALAICGLPPLNGFVSELLIYLGLFRTLGAPGTPGTPGTPGPGAPAAAWPAFAALAAPALALAGAIAVAGFVKLLGTVFAGSPRSGRAARAHDPPRSMLAPMAVLAGCCIGIGLFPGAVVGALSRAAGSWGVPAPEALAADVPFGRLTAMSLALVAAAGAGLLCVRLWVARGKARAGPTWDCGYARPAARIQYTGSSFSQMLVDLLAWVVWPRRKQPPVAGPFPRPSRFASDVPDAVLDRGLRPAFAFAGRLLGGARVLQRGPIQVYLLYVAGILLVLLLLA